MASNTEEPRPRVDPLRWSDPELPLCTSEPLPAPALRPALTFADVLASRRSQVGAAILPQDLSNVLDLVSNPSVDHPTGRFGLPWREGSSPSAGGLHPIRLMVMPIGSNGTGGLYDGRAHALLRWDGFAAALPANAESVELLTGGTAGTTVQLVADGAKTHAFYEGAESLLLRDAGALAQTLSLAATAMGLWSCVLGRLGSAIVRQAGLADPWRGVGAVHLSRQPGRSTPVPGAEAGMGSGPA